MRRQKLYYYTTTQTMQKIVTNGNLFATNVHYMNDSQEYYNGIFEIQKIVRNKELTEEWNQKQCAGKPVDFDRVIEHFTDNKLEELRQLSNSYSISFCVKRDLLSQWSMYARESGVSLTMMFDLDEKMDYLTYEFASKDNGRKKLCEAVPRAVYYFTEDSMKRDQEDPLKYKKEAEHILTDFFEPLSDGEDIYENLEERWQKMSTYVKRYDFYQESEYRLVFDVKDTPFRPKIEFRGDRNVLKPYLDIQCRDGWPIIEITVGPGFNQEAVFKSLKHFLDNTVVVNQVNTKGQYGRLAAEYINLSGWKEYADQASFADTFLNLENRLKGDADDEERIDWEEKEELHILINAAIKEVKNLQDKGFEKLIDYFENNYFSVPGIVLNRSKIPYIF